jgi:hypothetical protein
MRGLALMRPPFRDCLMTKPILTPEVLAGIPALIEQGLCKADIAERLGCKVSTLAVRCSTAGISLKGHKKLVLRDKSPVNLSRKALAGLTARAAAIGCTPAQLAAELLETIARDNLYDAVLDKATLQPSD